MAFKQGDKGIDVQTPLIKQQEAMEHEVQLLSDRFDIVGLSLDQLRTEILNEAMLKNGLIPSGDKYDDLLALEELYRIQTAEFLELDPNDPNSDWLTLVVAFDLKVNELLEKLDGDTQDRCLLEMNIAKKSAITLQDRNKFIAQWEVLQRYIES